MSASFQHIEANLYRRGSYVYARITEDGTRTWRGTGTKNLTTARKTLEKWRDEQTMKRNGVEIPRVALARSRLTIAKMLDAYLADGCRTKKGKPKSPNTLPRELANMKPLRAYFGDRPGQSLSLIDCDKYRDWRNARGHVTERRGKDGKPTPFQTKGGDRSVDLELGVLSNALRLAARRGLLKMNPLADRESYRDCTKVRHCREVAPDPEGLAKIEQWFRQRDNDEVADLICLLAFTGLRIGEALALEWKAVDWLQDVLHVKRAKRGSNPFVPMLPDLVELLLDMKQRKRSHFLFPSPIDPGKPREQRGVNRRLTAACKSLGLAHVTPHGLRSFYVTQARQSGLTDAEIAALIGDKSGPAIIAAVYGDVRPDHLFAQAKRIQLRATGAGIARSRRLLPTDIPALADVGRCKGAVEEVGRDGQTPLPQRLNPTRTNTPHPTTTP